MRVVVQVNDEDYVAFNVAYDSEATLDFTDEMIRGQGPI